MSGRQRTDENQGGHEEQFLAAFEEYSDALFRHAYLRVSDREQAIDLVHDTFTKAWSFIRNGHEIDAYRPFLYKILNNKIVDTYRRRKESSLDAMMEGEGVDESAFAELSEDTTERIAATIDGRQAVKLLETLPDEFREVLVLRFIDGLGPKEISALTEETENVVSVRIHRGLKRLRDTINAESTKREHNRTKK